MGYGASCAAMGCLPGETFSVQTGNMVYGINRAHGLHWVGKEGPADAVEGNQCHGPTSSIDC